VKYELNPSKHNVFFVCLCVCVCVWVGVGGGYMLVTFISRSWFVIVMNIMSWDLWYNIVGLEAADGVDGICVSYKEYIHYEHDI
jgi:hypothetical protein